MLLNLNHKTQTADKLILEKKIFKQKKKNNYQLCKETYMYCDIRYGTRLNTIVRLQSLKPIVDTLIEYLLDEDTLIIRIQCSVFEVL